MTKSEVLCPHYQHGVCHGKQYPMRCSRQHLVFSQRHGRSFESIDCGKLIEKIVGFIDTDKQELLNTYLTTPLLCDFTQHVYLEYTKRTS